MPANSIAPLLKASQDLNGHFFSLIDSMSALKSLTRVQVEHISFEQMLDQAIESLIAHQDLERCSIFVLRDDHLECAAGRDWDDLDGLQRRHESKKFALNEGIMGKAVGARECIVCEDCAVDADFKSREASSGAGPQDGALMCAPVIAREQVLGVVNIYHPQAHFFTSWHRHILVLFANVLAQMMDNHRLLEDMGKMVNQRTEHLETALAEAHRLRQQYEHLALVDDLTGLYNRRYFLPQVDTIVGQCIRHGHDFSMAVIDINERDTRQQRFGYRASDDALIQVAAVLRAELRGGDVLARLAGEEFALALPDTGLGGAAELCDRLLESVAELAARQDTVLAVSIGLSSLLDRRFNSGMGPTRDLLDLAEQALSFARTGAAESRVTAFAELNYPH